MKARVDPAACEGYGDCNQTLPEVFLLDEWGYAYTVEGGAIPAGKEELARLAEAECPVHAITIEE